MSLVIDAGTCLKVDFISQAGREVPWADPSHPGMAMRYRSLHRCILDRLPLVEALEDSPDMTGSDTRGSLSLQESKRG